MKAKFQAKNGSVNEWGSLVRNQGTKSEVDHTDACGTCDGDKIQDQIQEQLQDCDLSNIGLTQDDLYSILGMIQDEDGLTFAEYEGLVDEYGDLVENLYDKLSASEGVVASAAMDFLAEHDIESADDLLNFDEGQVEDLNNFLGDLITQAEDTSSIDVVADLLGVCPDAQCNLLDSVVS